MNFFDWIIMLIPLTAVIVIGGLTQKLMHSVAGFLSGERCAGRYLLAVADGSAGLGLISMIAILEQYHAAGFVSGFWTSFSVLISLTLALTGFVTYRFRETRALTMAQFFEIRYSRNVRIFAGIMAFLSGLLNYGIFPAVGGRFLIYYCGLPEYFSIAGITISTLGFVMAMTLGGALLIVLMGGQITTMVTDCVQGIFSYIVYIFVIVAIFTVFSFADFEAAMLTRPEGKSFVNPYNIGQLTGFNVFYYFISIISTIYARNAWLGCQGYMSAASSPHEQKMAGLLATWRNGFFSAMMMVIVLGCYTYLNDPEFAAGGAAVRAELVERINLETPGVTDTIRNQMMLPVTLRHILPHGVIGLFCALAMFLMISTDTTYLHSWGTILAQDVILPIRGKPISQKAQLTLIRCCIAFIAVFAWVFSMYFGQVDFILMFMAATGTIWLGGAGCLIIGGLYSRRGTAAGAYTAMIISMIMGIGGLCLMKQWEPVIYPWWAEVSPESLEGFRSTLEKISDILPIISWETSPEKFARKFPITSQEIYAATILFCVIGYFIASRLSRKPPFNLEKMLHRGIYAPPLSDEEKAVAELNRSQKRSAFSRAVSKLVGITDEYSRGDRILAWSVLCWSMLTFVAFIILVTCNTIFGRWSELMWYRWFERYTLPLFLLYGAITTVWFTWGGIRDLLRLFKKLSSFKTDESDNGSVEESAE